MTTQVLKVFYRDHKQGVEKKEYIKNPIINRLCHTFKLKDYIISNGYKISWAPTSKNSKNISLKFQVFFCKNLLIRIDCIFKIATTY